MIRNVRIQTSLISGGNIIFVEDGEYLLYEFRENKKLPTQNKDFIYQNNTS